MNENETFPQNFTNGSWDEDFRSEAHLTAMLDFQKNFEDLIDSLSGLEKFVLEDAAKSGTFKAGNSEHEPLFTSKAHAIAQGLVDHYNARTEDGE